MMGSMISMMVPMLVSATSAPNYMSSCVGVQLPWCNTSLSLSTRLDDLIGRLTVDEKITQLNTFSFTNPPQHNGLTPGVVRIGLPPYDWHTEGLHGVRDASAAGLHNSTLFPQVVGMAATGNLTLIGEMAVVMGREFRALNNVMRAADRVVTRGGGLSVYGPTINIIRDARWGRNQESVSEDPWLAGAYADAFMRGVQGADPTSSYLAVAATCKHLAAYSIETERHDSNAEVSALDLQETYLPAFQACVAAGSAQIMCSYNKINGLAACLHGDIQNGLLRRTWGFDGTIVSDCDAIADVISPQEAYNGSEAVALALKAGTDIDCGGAYAEHIQAALSDGLLREADLDAALRRAFTLRFRLGEMGETDAEVGRLRTALGPHVVGSAPHVALAAQAAKESLVLLKNDAGLLPLDRKAGLRVALIGPLANSTDIMYGGKHDYDCDHVGTVLEGLRSVVPASSLTFAPGLASVTDTSTAGFEAAAKAAAASDVAVLALGIDSSVESEGKDRTTVGLTGAQEELLRAVVSSMGDASRVIVLLLNGGPLSVDYAKEHVPTILEAFEPGQEGGAAIAEALFGGFSPSGVLPYSIYAEADALAPPLDAFAMRPNATTGYAGRTYRFSTATPLWPFGFGLTYTSFTVQWHGASSATVRTVSTADLAPGGSGASVSATVRNTGRMLGSKVVQVFVTVQAEPTANGARTEPSPPIRSLAAMAKVALQPGEMATAAFELAVAPGACPMCTVQLDGTRILRAGRWRVSIGDGAADHVPPWTLEVVGADVIIA